MYFAFQFLKIFFNHEFTNFYFFYSWIRGWNNYHNWADL